MMFANLLEIGESSVLEPNDAKVDVRKDLSQNKYLHYVIIYLNGYVW